MPKIKPVLFEILETAIIVIVTSLLLTFAGLNGGIHFIGTILFTYQIKILLKLERFGKD